MRHLIEWLAANTAVQRAYLAIDAGNAATLGVARVVGAVVVAQYLNADGRPNIRHVIPVQHA